MSLVVGAAPPAVTFEDVTFAYGPTTAVENVSFSVEMGDFVAVIGPNGSGKTTLVKLILGLERPAKGRVLLFGHEAQDFKQWRDIGYVPQSTSAFQVRFPATVGEVVSYGKYRGLDPLAFFRRGLSPDIKRALETVNMWTYRNRLINDLSTGQQQRVLVARALVRWPKLLILDEPIAGVDIGGQEQFYSLLREIRHQDIGVTVILVSHDVGVVLHEATKVACINRNLHYYGAPQEVSDEALSSLYGSPVDLVIHRHE